jgi:bla regulator protein blaR1
MFELTLRSTLILAVAWLVARALGGATAATRHLVWHSAVLAVLLAPLLAPAVPKFAIPRVPMLEAMQTRSPGAVDVPATAETAHLGTSHPSTSLGTAHPGTDLGTARTLRTFRTDTVGAVSAAGTIAAALWFSFGWIAAARAARRATPAPAAWQMEINTLRLRLHIAREVRLGIVRGNGSPVAVGLWRSMVLLPETSRTWDDDRRRMVLLHELAHIRRGDCRVQALAQAACAAYWFNPLVWTAAAHLRSERERACDDEVLRMGAQPSAYAAHLLEIARGVRLSLRPSAALAMARPSELEGRLVGILTAGRARVPARSSRWAVASTLAITTGAALGATPGGPPRDVAASVATTVVAGFILPAEATVAPPNRAVRLLQDALSNGTQDEREKAAMKLAFTSGTEVIPALLLALTDPDAQVREKAAIGLALRRDDRIIEPLLRAMQDPDSQVREKVAIALGASGDARAAAALDSALDDADDQVREKARAGLLLLGMTHK